MYVCMYVYTHIHTHCVCVCVCVYIQVSGLYQDIPQTKTYKYTFKDTYCHGDVTRMKASSLVRLRNPTVDKKRIINIYNE